MGADTDVVAAWVSRNSGHGKTPKRKKRNRFSSKRFSLARQARSMTEEKDIGPRCTDTARIMAIIAKLPPNEALTVFARDDIASTVFVSGSLTLVGEFHSKKSRVRVEYTDGDTDTYEYTVTMAGGVEQEGEYKLHSGEVLEDEFDM